MKSLSPNQKKVVSDLQRGGTMYYLRSFPSSCFFEDGDSISWSTVFALEKRGLVERTTNRLVLTEKGKSWEV